MEKDMEVIMSRPSRGMVNRQVCKAKLSLREWWVTIWKR